MIPGLKNEKNRFFTFLYFIRYIYLFFLINCIMICRQLSKMLYFCAAKFKVYHPDKPLLLMLTGNDSLERIFGNKSLKAGHAGCNTLGFIHCSCSISKCEDILSKHPNWVNKHDNVMKRLCLDYSSPNNWIQESLKLKNVDIKQAWSNRKNIFSRNLGLPLISIKFTYKLLKALRKSNWLEHH